MPVFRFVSGMQVGICWCQPIDQSADKSLLAQFQGACVVTCWCRHDDKDASSSRKAVLDLANVVVGE